ncbi:hypothetical protein ACEWY4_023432 [Coilia grayii]|uniref:ABC transporter domain-containing protein n=1 Tax=Coilia grayii TaxID=363190 RepID=A0ABD1J3Z5_9TELE
MASFFHQLRLLLWKNGLSVIRQPGWSLALIIWPLVIFIILAITRSQFPPQIKDTCYVAPRNLPSAGFFPFLQTLMCNTDTSCSNHSRLSGRRYRAQHGHRVARDTADDQHHHGMVFPSAQPPVMTQLQHQGLIRNTRSTHDADSLTDIAKLWNILLNSSSQATPPKSSLLAALNNTIFLNKGDLQDMLKAVDQLKQSFCKLSLSTVDPSLQENDPLVVGLVTFCKTNDTFLEVSLIILNKVMTQVILNNPSEAFNTLGVAIAIFEHFQQQESFWELLLDLPNLFLLPTDEEKLADGAQRLESLKSTLTSIQSSFPETNISVTMVKPVIEGGISLLKYMSAWRGKDVYIPLKDVMMPLNVSSVTSDIIKLVELVAVPLTKAAVLIDRASFTYHLCGNSSAPSWLQQACSSGQVDVLFDWISPQKVVEQVLLAWGDGSASADVEFAKQFFSTVLNSTLTAGIDPTNTRSQRSSLGQPQNVQEELFVSIGSVAIQLMQGLPGWETVHSILMGGHASMQLATQAMITQQELMSLFLKDAQNIQATFQGLMHVQFMAEGFSIYITNSAINSVLKAVQGQVECSRHAALWSWLSSLSSLDPQLWETLVCPANGSRLEEVLMAPLLPVIQKVHQLVGVFEGTQQYNVSATMILAEWHKLLTVSQKNGQFLPYFFNEFDQEFFDSFILTNITVDWLKIMKERALGVLDFATNLEHLWPAVVPQFKQIYYVITYQPNVTAPPNCTMDQYSFMPLCDTGYTSQKFIAATEALIEELSTNPAALLRLVQGYVAILQSTYRDFYIGAVTQLLRAPGQLPGDGSIGSLLGNLIRVLDKDIQLVSNLMSVEQFASHLPMSLLSHIQEVFMLKPIEELWSGDTNASSIISAILEVAENNQYLLSGLPMNQSDLSSANFAAVIMKWLQVEVNLTMPISTSLSEILLTYSAALSTTDLAFLEQVLKPLANQTSEGVAELALRALMLLKEVVDASSGDVSKVVLAYVRQLQEFLVGALQLQQYVQLLQPGGGLSPGQITNLRPVVMDLLHTLSPESIQALNSKGWLAVVDAVLRQLGATVPQELQTHYQQLVSDTHGLLADLNLCLATGQDCAAGVSQVAQILSLAAEAMLAGPSGDLVLQFGPIQGNLTLSVTEKVLALFRPWTNASSSQQLTTKTVAQVLHFLQDITSKPNISLTALKQALSSSNLDLYELDKIAQLTVNTSVSIMLLDLTSIANIQQCLREQSHNASINRYMNSTGAECALKLIQKSVSFLQTFPLPQKTKSDLMALKLMIEIFAERMEKETVGLSPVKLSEEIIRKTLQNIEETLKNLNHSNTDEIINELNVLDGIFQLGFQEQYPYYTINHTLLGNQEYAQRVYTEIAQWYLKKLENATSGSAFAELLFPIFRVTQMQIALNLVQSEFNTLVTQQIEGVISQVQLPLDGHDLRRIGHAIVTILRGQLELIKTNLKLQQDYYDSIGMPVNTSIPKHIEEQFMMYINLTNKWTSDPSFTSAFASLLQWDLHSVNISTVDTDILKLLKAIVPLLSAEEQAYLAATEKAYQALIHVLQVASHDGLQSGNFTEAVLSAARVILEVGTVPNATIHQILGALGSSLQLFLHPDLSYAQSNHLSLVLARSLEDLIGSLMPRAAADVLLPMTSVITTYFETISQPAGPDQWNIIVVNILKGLTHSLPQNNTAQPFLSLTVRVIEFILNVTQGNTLSNWQNIGHLNITDINNVAEQLEGVLASLLPLLEDLVQGLTPQHAKAIADTLPVLLQIISGQANQHTFQRLERIAAVLLSTIRGTPAWNNATLHVIIEVIAMMADNLNAQAELIHSIQEPLSNLTLHLLQAVNTSSFNMVDFFREFQLAVQNTVQAVIQTSQEGRALNCTDVLKIWEAAGQAVGVPPSSLNMWCHISLLPFIKARGFTPYNAMEQSAQSFNGTDAEIVKALASLYDASLLQSSAVQQLITVLTHHIYPSQDGITTGAQHYWMEQLFQLQLYQSFSGIQMALDQVELVAPWMHPYVLAVEKATEYTLQNSQRLLNTNLTQQVLMEALEVLLTAMNYSQHESIQQVLSGYIGVDALSVDRLLKYIIKDVIGMRLLGDWPVAYGVLEQVLYANGTDVVLERVIDLVNWLGTTNETGVGFLTHALPKLYDVVRAVLEVVSHIISDLPPYSDMLSDLVGNTLNVLRQVTRTSDLFDPVDAYLADFQRSIMPMGHASPRRMRREVSREPMDDFLDLLQIEYGALFHALSIEPSPQEIIETVHVLFANPDLAIILKGLSNDMTGGSEQDETIDTALGVLSYLSMPSQSMKFADLFVEIVQDGWNVDDLGKLEKLAESLARTVDIAIILSKQPSLNITQRMEQIAKQVSGVVEQIVSHPGNTTDVASEFIMALNNILLENIEEAKDISPQITAILKLIITAASKPGSQISLLPYMMALDQTVSAFAPVLSAENLMYFNISGQMIKAFATLASYPYDLQKVLQSVHLISATLNHTLTYSGEVSLPGGRSIEEVVHPMILNSALATHILWNLSSVSHTFSSSLERQMMVIQSIEEAVSLLPEHMQAYTTPLRPVLLSALAWASSTDQIRPDFMGISSNVTASLLAVLNVTLGPVSSNEQGPARILYVVSNLVSQSLFEGLLMASPSTDSLSDMLTYLKSTVATLSTVLPAKGSHYLNVSQQLLENVARAVNYTSATGDLEGAVAMVADFVHTLVSVVQYSGNETTGSVMGDLEATLKRALQIILSGGDPLEQAAGVSQQVLHSIHGLLSLASGGTELDLAKLVLGATKMNVGHLLLMNDTNWLDKLPMVLADIATNLPDGLPFSGLIKNITLSLSQEPQENLNLLLQTLQTAADLLMTDMWNANYSLLLNRMLSQLCALERMDAVQQLTRALSLPPGLLCQSVAPAMQALHELTTAVAENTTQLYNVLFELFVGDPATYNIQPDWASIVSKIIGFDVNTLGTLDVNTTAPQDEVKVSGLLLNVTSFAIDVHKYTHLPPEIIQALLNFTLPSSNLQILAMLTNLRHCSSPSPLPLNNTQQLLFRAFCTLRPDQWYNFAILFTRHASVENVIYKLLLSSDMQGLVGVMLQMVRFLTDMMNKLLPAIHRLQDYLVSFGNLNLVADSEFHSLVRGKRSTISSKSTFVTISRALCRNGIMALFGISKLPIMTGTESSTKADHSREELIDKFMIPRDASPFCMNFYLDMVNTTGGAVAWAFLKPMLLGQVLYTPDTPLTREIIRKSNGTLHQFGLLKSFSEDWLLSSSYVMQSAELLNKTLPLLKNSLSNPFVKNFIESQTNVDISLMTDTLQNFSNMTVLLEKNKFIVTQITTLSTLMMNLSSCVNFDRYKAMKSVEEMDQQAEVLAKSRDLYASVIFKLPKENSSSLPEKVDYTIRMQIDNSMRTDRTRNPFWVRDSYITMTKTQRYNRGFIYLQEAIDRAIIETQLGQPVQEPAVQLQAFPYPCFFKDEYLDSISFAFPLVLMIAWVLFVANFVKKLVHERELRLHEYMKMMGVNPISHFFAWFIESACFLLVTIVILTVILKVGRVLPHSDAFLLFLYLCDYGLSILAISFLISSFFSKTNVAGLSGSLIYVICFFPFIVVMSLESNLSLGGKTALSLFSPTCFSYASQYISRYEAKEEGIQWSNTYVSPMVGDTASFGWLCWLLLIDSLIYFIIGAYIRMVFPGKYGIPAPWYFPVLPSFWCDLFGCQKTSKKAAKGLFFSNIMQKDTANNKNKANGMFPAQEDEFPDMPVGVALHGLTKTYGRRHAIHNLNLAFYEGHVTTLLGHNGAGKTTTMSLLTGLFGPTSGTIEVYGRDMQAYIDDIRRDLGVCMQYDVLFDDLTAKEHLLLYGQIKSPHWSQAELKEQVCRILKETGMYAHRHKRASALSGGMKRKLSISIAFIGGSRLVVLDEPTTGVDPCSRRSIWDIILQRKTDRTIILSTHHLDEAEVLSDRIAFMERGGLKCCGSPFYLKDKLAQGYNLTLTKKVQSPDSEEKFDSKELKAFIQSYLPEARMKEGEVGDVVYCLPPYSSQNAPAYRALLTSLDQNLDALQLGCYGVSDTTLEEVFLQLTKDEADERERPWSISESVLETAASRDSLPDDLSESSFSFADKAVLTGASTVRGLALVWQQVLAMLLKRMQHSRRDWKGMFAQVILPVLFVIAAMGLGSIKSNLQHFPEMQLSPGLYHTGEQYAFFSNQNPNSNSLVDTMMSFPGIDDVCSNNPNDMACAENSKAGPHTWTSQGNSSKPFKSCKCSKSEQVCERDNYHPPHIRNPSSQIVYNLTGINVEDYLLATANDFIRNRYGGWSFGKPLPPDLKMDLYDVPLNRTLTKVWYNPEGHHTMPAYLNSLNNFILRSSLPADKDHRQYSISVSSHPYPGQVEEEDAIVKSLVYTLVALCVLTGYSIMTASFVVYEVQEHHTGSKRLQHISGISEPFYWTINFIYDMALYMVPVALSVAMIAAFQLPAFTERQNLGAVTLLLVLFGFATFPWMYLLTAVFKDAEMAFISYVCINLFISVNTIISTAIVYFLGQLNENDESIQAVYQTLSRVFLVFPQFSFGNGLMELARVDMQVQILKVYGVDAYKDPFGTDMLGWMFLSLVLQGLLAFTLRLLLNKWLMRKVRRFICRRKAVPQRSSWYEDEDVVAEHRRVDSGAASADVLQLNQLTKIYQHLNKKVQAVKKLSVGIPAGECFGLLGVNGAGKTTTFKMLTGDISPTDGLAQIRDWDGRMVDIMDCRKEGINIGYCPQVDALDDLLTGEEHLYFYSRIRGISKREMDKVVNYLLRKLELEYHRNNTSESYSCGTRRKLSTALALIGHPQILLLDEPSSGMDPRSKRHLWKIISEEVMGKCAVVLTSHSMEECEALCTRLAIMVQGQFRCLGSLQHIKNRFGSGFTVKMYLAVASCNVDVITNFMQEHFPSTYLKDHHSTMVEYHVPIAPGGVADIFDQLESNKTALQIKHFSVSQTTLDEVFINFAMGKVGMEMVHSEGSDADSLNSFDSVDT